MGMYGLTWIKNILGLSELLHGAMGKVQYVAFIEDKTRMQIDIICTLTTKIYEIIHKTISLIFLQMHNISHINVVLHFYSFSSQALNISQK